MSNKSDTQENDYLGGSSIIGFNRFSGCFSLAKN